MLAFCGFDPFDDIVNLFLTFFGLLFSSSLVLHVAFEVFLQERDQSVEPVCLRRCFGHLLMWVSGVQHCLSSLLIELLVAIVALLRLSIN